MILKDKNKLQSSLDNIDSLSGLSHVHNKSNYMEYITKIEVCSKVLLKGTPGVILLKGIARRNKVLCFIFQTWLYFVGALKISLCTSVSGLLHFLLPGCIFRKVRING